jgi:hypothetical protein
MSEAITVCVIMHNMMIEKERNDIIFNQMCRFQGILTVNV